MKKIPTYSEQQKAEWNSLFDSLEYGCFEHNIFSQLYHKGYCYFYKEESIYKDTEKTINAFLPKIPYSINDVDSMTLEIDINC